MSEQGSLGPPGGDVGFLGPPSGDFGSLIERARAAHDSEVQRLRLEVRSLRQLLAAAPLAAPAEAGGGGGGAAAARMSPLSQHRTWDSLSSVSREEVEDFEFTVAVDRTSGQKLGMKCRPVRAGDGGFLAITAEMSGGLFQQWNASHPTLAVKPGDRLVEVNGIRNDVDRLRSEVRQHKVLQLRVRRGKDDLGCPALGSVGQPPAVAPGLPVFERAVSPGSPPHTPGRREWQLAQAEGAEGAARCDVRAEPPIGSLSQYHRQRSISSIDSSFTVAKRDNTNTKESIHRGLSFASHHKQIEAGIRMEQGWLWRMVTSPAFEMTIAVLITLNGLLFAAEAQNDGFSLAERTGHASASGRDVWPGALAIFEILNLIFGIIFMVEIVIRILALRSSFAKDAWNWVDFTLVLLWLFSTAFPVDANAAFIRFARLGRLIRLLRLVKFLHGQQFDSLFLMSSALRGSMSILGWSLLVLLVMHFMLALIMNRGLREFYFDSDIARAKDDTLVFEYFGSFSRAFLTVFEITLANWPEACRVLVEEVHELFVVYAVLHKMVFGFAVVGVMNAVFIQETFKSAELDDTLMIRQTMRREGTHRSNMQRLFVEADANGDGMIDVDEWKKVCEDEWVQLWLRSQDLRVNDAERLFRTFDKGTGLVDADALIQGMATLKGTPAIMDVRKALDEVMATVEEIKASLDARHEANQGTVEEIKAKQGLDA